ncbi:DUF5825 family protein [Actinopolyspora saharensis]|uniref:Uncharacterized protein n=1 Tax=Actinopolyspora saharensis TaxID=995062 RepID=A0A1H1EGZ5_9ACTN|nr:DUF5825 family protein [Actinopolyspora saharensis]SDQ87729.1 hypothetical protein SAMN04489718_2526 [Actinopolyspora saharensis]
MRILLHESTAGSVAGRAPEEDVVRADPVGQAEELFAGGVRAVVLSEPVRIGHGGDSDTTALSLLRELGAWGVPCSWWLHCANPHFDWHALSHLRPPEGVTGRGRGIDLTAWRESCFPCRCVQREGPGFIQIRDRRNGVMECYTVDDPELVQAARGLSNGADPETISAVARERFAANALLVRVGAFDWWAPARVRRWPVPAMVV